MSFVCTVVVICLHCCCHLLALLLSFFCTVVVVCLHCCCHLFALLLSFVCTVVVICLHCCCHFCRYQLIFYHAYDVTLSKQAHFSSTLINIWFPLSTYSPFIVRTSFFRWFPGYVGRWVTSGSVFIAICWGCWGSLQIHETSNNQITEQWAFNRSN